MSKLSNLEKGAKHAEALGAYLCECRSGARQIPVKKDGTINKSQIAKEVGFLRASFTQNDVCAELIAGAEKEFNTKTIDVESDEERSETVKRLERKVQQLEKRVADLLVSNSELRRTQKTLDFTERMLAKTGWIVE